MKKRWGKAIARLGANPDLTFVLISALASFAAVFIFDIHHSFYPGHDIFKPDFIFTNLNPYFIGVVGGTVFGFILLKLLVHAIMLEENEAEGSRN